MKIFVDSSWHLKKFVSSWIHGEFTDFDLEPIVPGAIYLVGTLHVQKSIQKIRHVIDNELATIVYVLSTEGSSRVTEYVQDLGISDLLESGKMLLVCGAPISESYVYCAVEHCLAVTTEIDTNQHASKYIDQIYAKINKPYKFLFLNGTPRPHRLQLLKRLTTLLNHSLYTWTSQEQNRENIKLLPPEYESSLYVNNLSWVGNQKINVLQRLFNGGFGGIHAVPAQYTDTYFSLVTETVFDQPPSFRTEKIWKPILMGHPFIVAANSGFYQDLRNMGFKTFGNVIDESFDQIHNADQRLERIAQVVEDLCQQDLNSFLVACEPAARHNQQLVFELGNQMLKELPTMLNNFIQEKSKTVYAR
jgi:hypothetical protein